MLKDCLAIYSESLEEPLHILGGTAIWSNGLYSLLHCFAFVISLVLWYGSLSVFFIDLFTFGSPIGLMSTVFGAIQAGTCSRSCPTSRPRRGPCRTSRTCSSRYPRSTEGNVPKNVQGDIKSENVHFRYPTRPGVRVLRDSNLDLKSWTYGTLVGTSGFGGSTV